MDPIGFLHDKTDVKILILFILNRMEIPLSQEDLYAVAFQDDSLNYFVFVESLEELLNSGHIEINQSRYTITEKGRVQGGYVEDSLAIPIVKKVTSAIEAKKDQIQRDSFLTTSVTQDENGHWISSLDYRDGEMPMMRISLMAPSKEVGVAMAENMKQHIDLLYKTSMECATDASKKAR